MSIYHKHHIIPKHMGGTDDPSNLVEVTVKQHALLHKQLWEDLGYWQDYAAWQGLSNMMGREEIIRFLTTGERHHQYGKPRPDEVKAKISSRRRGQSLASWTEERRKKTVASLKGKRPCKATMEAARKAAIGSKRTEETKQKMREAQKNRRLREKGVI
jgi:hypothetical protein